MTMMDKGIALTILVLTVNAVLFIAMPSIDRSYGMAGIFALLDPDIAKYGVDATGKLIPTENYVETDVELGAESIEAGGTDSDTTNIPMAKSQVPFIGGIWDIITKMLLGYAFATAIAGVPAAIIFIVGVPLSLIVTVTIGYLLLMSVSAIAGVFIR